MWPSPRGCGARQSGSGRRIVEERPFKYEVGSRRADGGHEQIQEQIPALTRNASAHDVLVVADESGLFGEYLPYRTWDPRPVAGTHGLVPTSWHPALEQWGATQLQNRFRRLANRAMRPLDYDVWVAVRSIGEAATRAKSPAPGDLIAHLKSTDFDLAAFKGRKLTYRALGRTTASADPGCDRKAAGDRLAASGLPAPVHRARYARHRQAGDQLPGLRPLSSLLDCAREIVERVSWE